MIPVEFREVLQARLQENGEVGPDDNVGTGASGLGDENFAGAG